jgi:PKD repeat protein
MRKITDSIPQRPVDREAIFTWSPNVGTFTWQADGITYPEGGMPAILYTPANTLITFQATFRAPITIRPLDFEWDFGDGNRGNGRIITHTFRSAAPARVVLSVSDNAGGYTTVAQELVLINAGIINIVPNVSLLVSA